ncbi:DUF4158 domain-containing protein [Saccharopolyspora hattusasensis]|uniref:DUF4158 domain-containing protein n=1 Tax=Saccharopolyspora hattusasensis TaxID=1128679 RepID=UPI003D96794F
MESWPVEVSRDELVQYFTLTPEDVAWVNKSARGTPAKLGLAVQLCALPWLGFVPEDVQAAPTAAVSHAVRSWDDAPSSGTPNACYLTLEDLVDVEVFEPGTVTVSVRATDSGGWREIGRHTDVADALDVVCSCGFLVRAADYGIEPGTAVRVAVLGVAGEAADSYTTHAQ